jgi:hypothetical protein
MNKYFMVEPIVAKLKMAKRTTNKMYMAKINNE